jgi:UDP-N-acetylmuramate--alanine ligase
LISTIHFQMVPLTTDQVSKLLESAPGGSTAYLVGIGGCGMSGLAHLLLDLGWRVAGSDLVAGDETRQLQERGARIHLGHSAEQLAVARPALVVYSSAIRLDNPELQAAEQHQIPIVRRAVLLATLVNRQRGICVAGMHGKTTTSALLAFALENLSANPNYVVGALVPQLRRHARLSPGANEERSPSPRPSPPGRGSADTLLEGRESSSANQALSNAAKDVISSDHLHRAPSPGGEGGGINPTSTNLFIAEADESDGTLSEFRPQHTIVLNVDAEHLDYYANLEAICREFANFAQQTRETLVFCADDARLAELFARRPGAVSYGFHPLASYRIVFPGRVRLPPNPDISGAKVGSAGASPSHDSAASSLTPLTFFEVWHDGQKLGDFTLRLIGEKNISNAGAVITLLHRLGYAPEEIARAIADFTGAARRQQEVFCDARFRVFDDYGHHPAEIEATLKAFKSLGARRLLVAFQPHRFTRTRALMSEFATCFAQADLLWVTDIYAASESEIPGVTSAKLVEAIRAAEGGIREGEIVRPHPGPLPQGEGVRSSALEESDASGLAEKRDTLHPLPGGEGRGEGERKESSLHSAKLRQAEYISTLAGLRRAVRTAMLPGDVVLFLGAGDITKAAHELAAELREESVSSNEQLFAELTASLSPESIVRRDEPLAKRTTLRVGGRADYYVEPASEEDLSRALKFCATHQLKFTMLGRGSNLLIKDGGIRGVVICLNHPNFSRLEIIGDKLQCGAGVKLKAVSIEARRAGLAGLEFLEGIPGSLGGSMRMNAGAMGSWLFDVVEKIRFMDYSGVAHERMASEVNVEYRGCPLFKTHIAIGAVLKGTPATKETVASRMEQYSAKRWESQPKEPSAGCIFKNPKTIPAGKLIDELGLKGTRVGGAMVSDVHGNFIVNDGNATASDVLSLIDVVKQRVKSARGIELETEVEILGET